MGDSSILTLGTARSLLVDTSVYDSRIAETTKDHVVLGMACEDGEGQSAWLPVSLSLNISRYPYTINFCIDDTQ